MVVLVFCCIFLLTPTTSEGSDTQRKAGRFFYPGSSYYPPSGLGDYPQYAPGYPYGDGGRGGPQQNMMGFPGLQQSQGGFFNSNPFLPNYYPMPYQQFQPGPITPPVNGLSCRCACCNNSNVNQSNSTSNNSTAPNNPQAQQPGGVQGNPSWPPFVGNPGYFGYPGLNPSMPPNQWFPPNPNLSMSNAGSSPQNTTSNIKT